MNQYQPQFAQSVSHAGFAALTRLNPSTFWPTLTIRTHSIRMDGLIRLSHCQFAWHITRKFTTLSRLSAKRRKDRRPCERWRIKNDHRACTSSQQAILLQKRLVQSFAQGFLARQAVREFSTTGVFGELAGGAKFGTTVFLAAKQCGTSTTGVSSELAREAQLCLTVFLTRVIPGGKQGIYTHTPQCGRNGMVPLWQL